MRRIFLFILPVVTLFLFFVMTVKPAYAQTTSMSVSASPAQIDYNTNPVTITVVNIPKSNSDVSYNLKIYKNGVSGTEVGSIDINNGIAGCSPNVFDAGIWKRTPTCEDPEKDNTYTFTGQVDTSKIQFNPNSSDGENGMLYEAWVTGVSLPREGILTNFFINQTKNKAPFSIVRIDGQLGENTGTVKPGEDVRVFLKGVSNNKTYRVGVIEDQSTVDDTGVNCRADQAPNPPSGTCSLVIPIPSNATGKVTLFVMDPSTQKMVKRTVQVVTAVDPRPTSAVLSVTPIPTNSPTPKPTATPTPPQPPCALPKKVDGKFAGCDAVDFGIGRTIFTDPSKFVNDLFGLLLSISGGILLLLIIRSGYQFMTSQGNPEKIQEARERITSAIIGFIFLIFSVLILEIIGVDILRLPGFSSDSSTTPSPRGAAPTNAPIPSQPKKDAKNCGEKGKTPCVTKYKNNSGCQAKYIYKKKTNTCE